MFTCEFQCLVHGHWVCLTDDSPTGTQAEMLLYAEHEAITADTLGEGDGSNVVCIREAPGGMPLGYEVEDDCAAGASLVRWMVSEVQP